MSRQKTKRAFLRLNIETQTGQIHRIYGIKAAWGEANFAPSIKL